MVSDAYPTVTAQAADLMLPTAMWVEKEGAYGNAERRTHFWHQLVNAPGEARSDLWQLMEFSKRFKIEEVWPAESDRQEAGVQRQDALRRFVQEQRGRQISAVAIWLAATKIRSRRRSVFTSRKDCSRNMPHSGAATGTTSRRSIAYHEVRGLRWPVVNGKETRWRYREGYDPYVKAGKGVEFYGFPDGKARIFALPYEPPPESPDNDLSILAGNRPGARALALRLDDAARAGTLSRIPGRGLFHASGRCNKP